MRQTILLGCIATIFFASCSLDNVEQDASLQQYFKAAGVDGYFALFNNGSGKFTVYNLGRFRDSAYQPAETSYLLTALVGVETGRVQDATSLITPAPDDVDTAAPRQPVTLLEAFNMPASPGLRELALRIGKDTLQHWLDTLGYASYREKAVIDDNPGSFWFDNSVKITGDEQLGLVKMLYFGQLPFQARSQRIVVNMMKKEDNSNYRLSYLTGKGQDEQGTNIGWLVGWIEENKHPYFFVLQTESSGNSYDMHTQGVHMLKDILRGYEFMEGHK